MKKCICLLIILILVGCEKRLQIRKGKIESVQTLSDLDQVSAFNFIIMSDNKGDSGKNSNQFAKLEQRIKDCDTKFVIGLGDHVKKGYDNNFLELLDENEWWMNNFYPNIADGENEYYGKSQGDWGAGYKLIEKTSMNKNAHVEMCDNKVEYYLKRKIDDFTIHLIQLHYADQPADESFAFRAESKKFLTKTLQTIQKTQKDIVIAAAHSKSGFWFDKLSSDQQNIVLEKCDLVLSATTHFFERQIIPDYEKKGPLFINTGSITHPTKYSPFGFVQIHVLSYPAMLVVQYLDAANDTLEFQNSDYAFIKKINGEIIETNFRKKRPEEKMDRVIMFLPEKITQDQVKLLAENLYKHVAKTELAMVEINCELPEGEIKYAQLWDIFPYNNQICRVHLPQDAIHKELQLFGEQIQSDFLWVAMSTFQAQDLQKKLLLPESCIQFLDSYEVPAFEEYLQTQFSNNFSDL